MTTLRFRDQRYELAPGQSVLEALLEHGADIPHGCRNGVCQACLMQALEGAPPVESQQALSPPLRLRHHFLACVCRPTEALTAALPTEGESTLTAVVKRLEPLNDEILRVALTVEDDFDYRAGQFLHVLKNETLGRSYSLASVPGLDPHLELHVRRLPDGQVSGWIHETLQEGQAVAVRGPGGHCFYVPGQPGQALLLIGTGSGLAPLYGIVRDALRQGHTGPIRLFHGSRDRQGLYLVDELRELARTHPQFDYVPCLSGPERAPGHAPGRAHDVALAEAPDLKGWRVFLCGHPAMVQQAQMRAYLAGASLAEIHADAFTVQAPQPREMAPA